MTHPGTPERRSGADPVLALIVADGGRQCLGRWSERLVFCDRIADLVERLRQQPVRAVLTETRDAEGEPVPAALEQWVGRNPRAPVIVWTAGSRSALSEILRLSAAGGDVRLVQHPMDDLAEALERLLAGPEVPHPGAVPALLRGVVLGAPPLIQPELTLAVYLAWSRPSVRRWAHSLAITRQALNRRLAALGFTTASIILDLFSAGEIAIRLTQGLRLPDVAAEMGRSDERSLRRRLGLLGSRPEQLRDEADFRALIPQIAARVRRDN